MTADSATARSATAGLDGEGLGPAMDRRTVLKSVAATLALAGAAGCEGETDARALPYVEMPEFLVPGAARRFATAVPFAGYAQPVIGTTHDGRPTKLEGNPDHPASGGATDAVTQAALMDLYDPNRSGGPLRNGVPTSWKAFEQAAVARAAALDDSGGEGFRLLTGAVTSPTWARQLAAMQRRWPRMRWHIWEPAGDALRDAATQLVYGRRLAVRTDPGAADIVVCLDDDLLGPGPHQVWHAGRWAERRRAFHEGRARPPRLFVAEPTPTLTGSRADHRLPAAAGAMPALVRALAAAVGVPGVAAEPLSDERADWVTAAAAALAAAPQRALVCVGRWQPPAVQALGLRINEHLGNRGSAYALTEPIVFAPSGANDSLAALVDDMHAGRVTQCAIIGCNPAHSAPAGLAFEEACARVPYIVHAGRHEDETAALSHWHLPVQHALESWSDARAVDGAVSLIQPLVRPFLDVRSDHEVLELLQGHVGRDDHAIVQETWRDQWSGRFDTRWAAALQAGLVARSAGAPVDDPPQPDGRSAAIDPGPGPEVVLRPDPCVWDGRFAANAWLQELPKPLSKVTWDAAVGLSPDLAARLGVVREDRIVVEWEGGAVAGSVEIVPGQAAETVLLTLGYGRGRGAGAAEGRGYNAARLIAPDGAMTRGDIRLVVPGDRQQLAITQRIDTMEGQPLVRTVATVAEETAAEAAHVGPQPSFYPDRPEMRPSWGMSIDLDVCIGCNACVTACDMENSIPTVGAAEVANGREMHWLRVDRYYDGDRIHFQPVPCMHCEHAPCEMGCPVNATVHGDDGLNLQVYNRCIGTRTCSSYCPYKVRRFNWFDYTADAPPELQAARNPDVTVRSRGVMEKCTYCIQRISAARIAAKRDGRPIADGEVQPACAQACPTRAIVFGDVTDPDSAVNRRKAQSRDYTLLEEANTRPRTTYLARIDPDRRTEGDDAA